MRTRQKLFAMVAVTMMVVAAFGPAVGAAAVAANDSTGNDSAGNDTVWTGLSVSASENEDGSGVVTVTENGSAVANATVNVSITDGNESYTGAGSYETGEDGTVGLPAPANNSTVTLEIVAEHNDSNATTGITLGDGIAEGEEEGYEYDENETHGQNVAGYVHSLQSEDRMSGLLVAKFNLEHNPGKPGFPEHANGNGPAWARDDAETDEEVEAENETVEDETVEDETVENETDVEGEEVEDGATETEDDEGKQGGKPAHAGPKDGKEGGKPAHAGSNGNGNDK